MYEKEVKVIKKIDNNNILVSCPEDKCSACKSKMFCNAKDLQFSVMAKEGTELKEGENVSILLPFKKTILSLCLVFLVPLLFMFVFVAIAYYLGLEQKYQALASLLGLCLGMALEYLINKFCLKDKLKAEVVEKKGEEEKS